MSDILITKIDTDYTEIRIINRGWPRQKNINRIFATVETSSEESPNGTLEVNLTDEEVEMFLALAEHIAARVRVEVAA